MFWKKEKNKGVKCSQCGEYHEEWPALVYDSPIYYHQLPDKEKSELAILSDDFCEIHYPDQTDRFIRVVLDVKVKNSEQTIQYGLWVSLSQKSFDDYKSNFKNQDHYAEYFGWIANVLPDYDDLILKIPVRVTIGGSKNRLSIVLKPDHNHPLVHDFYKGLSMEDAERRIHSLLSK